MNAKFNYCEYILTNDFDIVFLQEFLPDSLKFPNNTQYTILVVEEMLASNTIFIKWLRKTTDLWSILCGVDSFNIAAPKINTRNFTDCGYWELWNLYNWIYAYIISCRSKVFLLQTRPLLIQICTSSKYGKSQLLMGRCQL